MAGRICVDASLTLRLLLNEPDSDLVEALWAGWVSDGKEICAPPLLEIEAASVLRNRVHQGQITSAQGEEAFHTLRALDIRLLHPPGLLELAWELANRFGQPSVYDSLYLALAQVLGCEFWTADERLYNAIRGELPWVKRPVRPTS